VTSITRCIEFYLVTIGWNASRSPKRKAIGPEPTARSVSSNCGSPPTELHAGQYQETLLIRLNGTINPLNGCPFTGARRDMPVRGGG
jgi:hypothetical protein